MAADRARVQVLILCDPGAITTLAAAVVEAAGDLAHLPEHSLTKLKTHSDAELVRSGWTIRKRG